ncbi:hypothetical protein HYU92_05925 [Candidatus Curtissbacteria bacterium]|nr:hypothetical protein [Candidatus Curtissbacteria bacterium]
MLKIFVNIFNLVLHIPAIVLIYYFWQPIANWFLAKIPVLGVDLYLSATYVSYHLRNFLSLPFNSFKDIWFAGSPLIRDFPQLSFYLMMPFVAGEGPVVGVQKFTVFALLAIIVCCYLLFYKLSKNHGLALLLAFLVLLSPNLYGSATWAGSIPYFLSQAFFPLALLAGTFYLEGANARRLAAAILVVGIAFAIHPLSTVAFLIPSLLIMILFGGLSAKLPFWGIIKHLAFFNFGWLLAAFMVTYDYVITFFTQRVLPAGITPTIANSSGDLRGAEEIAAFYRNQIGLLFDRTDQTIFVIAGLGLLFFLFGLFFASKRRRLIFWVAAFLLIVFWTALHPAMNLSNTIIFFRHDPYRAFWQFTIASGAVGAFLWGAFISTVLAKFDRGAWRIFGFTLNLLVSLALVLVIAISYRSWIERVIPQLETNTEFSSAFPEALSIKVKKDELATVKKQLIPSFMDPNDKNFRLYSADAAVNIWWNAFFDMPMARGYVDPPIGTQSRGGFFWLDIAIANDSLVRDFKIEEDIAFNNALFLIDWYGIGYFEGGREGSKGPSPGLSSYLVNNHIFEKDELVTTYGAILKWLTASGRPELVPDLPQNLHFFKTATEYTSPILYPTDASAVVVVSAGQGYEDLLRLIATENINSKRLIPAKVDYIDDLSLAQLKAFDAVILHQYLYKNQKKAFDLLEKYVREGGKIFIDTGAEVGESESKDLPEIFPFKSSVRRGFGSEWELSGEGDLIKDINLGNFGPLIFNEDEWKLVSAENGLKDGAKVILAHKGMPVLVERNLGEGTVVWSGINLAYHYNQYKRDDEAKLFINILKQFTSLDVKKPLVAKTKWIKPEKVILETEKAPRGILFKEEAYEGWGAKINGKSQPIYKVGPTFPGFMYVPTGEKVQSPIKVEFRYSGRILFWFVAFVNLLVILLLLELLIFNGKFLTRAMMRLVGPAGRKLSFWWAREEE